MFRGLRPRCALCEIRYVSTASVLHRGKSGGRNVHSFVRSIIRSIIQPSSQNGSGSESKPCTKRASFTYRFVHQVVDMAQNLPPLVVGDSERNGSVSRPSFTSKIAGWVSSLSATLLTYSLRERLDSKRSKLSTLKLNNKFMSVSELMKAEIGEELYRTYDSGDISPVRAHISKTSQKSFSAKPLPQGDLLPSFPSQIP